MCAVFSKNEHDVIPRYLHILLSRLSNQLLVPLMCGATNVTMNSSQLLELVLPIPKPDIQEEIIEIHLAEEHADRIKHVAADLKNSARRQEFRDIAEGVLASADRLLETAAEKTHIDTILGKNGYGI